MATNIVLLRTLKNPNNNDEFLTVNNERLEKLICHLARLYPELLTNGFDRLYAAVHWNSLLSAFYINESLRLNKLGSKFVLPEQEKDPGVLSKDTFRYNFDQNNPRLPERINSGGNILVVTDINQITQIIKLSQLLVKGILQRELTKNENGSLSTRLQGLSANPSFGSGIIFKPRYPDSNPAAVIINAAVINLRVQNPSKSDNLTKV